MFRRIPPVNVYIALVAAVGLPLLAAVAWRGLPPPQSTPWVTVAVLTAAVVIDEAAWVRVGGSGSGKKAVVSFSGAFALALLLLAPLAVAILAQLLANTIDDVRTRRAPRWVLFNATQYVITFASTATVFQLVTGRPTLEGHTLEVIELAGILAAAATWCGVNFAVTLGARALLDGRPVRELLFNRDLLVLLPYAIDVALAPVAIAVLSYSPLLMPLLALPPLVLHHASRIARLREHEARHDVLTDLPNRAYLHTAFSERLHDVHKGTHDLVVVLIDLDHFKGVNDTLGHSVGDALLCDVARRLQSVVRKDDVVARLGGDEFAVLTRTDRGSARFATEDLSGRLVDVLSQPFEAGEIRLDVQGSVGLALAPEQGTSADVLLSRADIALYNGQRATRVRSDL